MTRLIDADALYEQTAEWEARALSVIEKKNLKPFDEMDVNEIVEWRKWSCILDERSAFKHDVFDAPTIDAVQVIRCKDCKQCRKTILFGHLATVCDYWIKLTDDDGYCNHAERKEE